MELPVSVLKPSASPRTAEGQRSQCSVTVQPVQYYLFFAHVLVISFHKWPLHYSTPLLAGMGFMRHKIRFKHTGV